MIDDNFSRHLLIATGILGALAVILGAFGAHGLEQFLTDQGASPELVEKRLGQFDVGARYHLVHCVALLAMVSLPYGSPGTRRVIAALFVVGILLFSGSLYLLVLTNTPVLGAITPIGGLCWIIAWLALVWLGRKPHR